MTWNVWINIGRLSTACGRSAQVRFLSTTMRSFTIGCSDFSDHTRTLTKDTVRHGLWELAFIVPLNMADSSHRKPARAGYLATAAVFRAKKRETPPALSPRRLSVVSLIQKPIQGNSPFATRAKIHILCTCIDKGMFSFQYRPAQNHTKIRVFLKRQQDLQQVHLGLLS